MSNRLVVVFLLHTMITILIDTMTCTQTRTHNHTHEADNNVLKDKHTYRENYTHKHTKLQTHTNKHLGIHKTTQKKTNALPFYRI